MRSLISLFVLLGLSMNASEDISTLCHTLLIAQPDGSFIADNSVCDYNPRKAYEYFPEDKMKRQQ